MITNTSGIWTNSGATTNANANQDNWFNDIIPWITDILAGPLSLIFGWFAQAEWVSEVGELANDSCTPGTGILGELERRAGRTFPDLRVQQQGVVDRWRTFQRADPWDKERTAQTYEAGVKAFLAAVKAQIEALREVPVGGIADIWAWAKANWKTLAIFGSIAALGITGAIVATRGISREIQKK